MALFVRTHSFIFNVLRTLLRGFCFFFKYFFQYIFATLLFFRAMLLYVEECCYFLKITMSTSLEEVDPIWTLQVWDFGGRGLRRVRILKNDVSFLILMISVTFWTPQVRLFRGRGLRRVRILKNGISFLCS